MLAFIAGGAASGKSAWAESLAMALGGRKCYIATMEPFGEEAEIRIQHHRNARREKGFQTAEIYTGMAHSVGTLCCDTALLECMTNWMANEMYSPSGAGKDALGAVKKGIDALCAAGLWSLYRRIPGKPGGSQPLSVGTGRPRGRTLLRDTNRSPSQ